MEEKDLGTHGKITIYKRGYGWLPEILRKELNAMEDPKEIPFFLDAETALLIKKDATREEILKSLKALIFHLASKWHMEDKEIRKLLGL